MAGAWTERESIPTIGVVATNQARKDWGLIATVCALLTEQLSGKVAFWWHCDIDVRHWSLPALIADFQLGEYVQVTNPPCDDQWLAEQYRRCACTLAPSPEGFGYCAFESLACGTPCIAGDWAALGSLFSTCGLAGWLVTPYGERLEGVHNCVRPVYDARDFAAKVLEVLANPCDREAVAASVRHLGWDRLGHVWKKWFREGL